MSCSVPIAAARLHAAAAAAGALRAGSACRRARACSVLPARSRAEPTGRGQVAALDGERRWVRALDGTEYMPGLVGLNNMKANDYINVVVQARHALYPKPSLPSPRISAGALRAAGLFPGWAAHHSLCKARGSGWRRRGGAAPRQRAPATPLDGSASVMRSGQDSPLFADRDGGTQPCGERVFDNIRLQALRCRRRLLLLDCVATSGRHTLYEMAHSNQPCYGRESAHLQGAHSNGGLWYPMPNSGSLTGSSQVVSM